MKKEKIKNIIFKILHAIGYFSMIILTIIFVVSGVQSCNNKEYEAHNKNINNINNAIVLNNGDYLYSANEYIDGEIVNYYRYNVNALDGSIHSTHINNIVDIVYKFVSQNVGLMYVSFYYGSSLALAGIFDNATYINGVYTFNDYYGNNDKVWDTNNMDEYIPIPYFRAFIIPQGQYSNCYKTFEGCFNYCVGLEMGSNYQRSIKYYVNPYFTIKKTENSFYYNIAFKYQGVEYYAIEYVKDNYLKFYATLVNANAQPQNLTFRLTLSYSGEVYYYRFGSNTTDSVISSKTFEFIAFAKLGYEFLNKYFINDNNPRVSSINTIDLYNIINWVYIQPTNDSWQRKTLSFTFNSAGTYYTGIYLDYLKHSDNTIGLNITYRRADMNNLMVIELFYPNYNGTTEFDYSQIQLLTNETYATIITLDNVIYTSDVVFALDFIYSPYGVIEPPTIPQGDAFTSTFDLLTMAFNSVGGVLNIYILPNLTLGTLLIIPLLLTILLFVIWLFKR